MTSTTTEPAGPAPVHSRRLRRIRAFTGAGLAVAATLALVGVLMEPTPESKATTVTLESVAVTRGDLTEQVRASGTLAYAGMRSIGTPIPGVLTALPDLASVIGAGRELFRVDDQPVVLMHGALPVWRGFASGMEAGTDVLQLEQNLAALGYFTGQPDREFSWQTADAIKAWQMSIGLEVTGTIPVGRIVFAGGDVRVSAINASVGDPSGPALLTVSALGKEVVAALDPSLQSVAVAGAEVTIALPNGSKSTGTISKVGLPKEMEDKSLKIQATVTLNDPSAANDFDNVTVTVGLTQVRSRNVLIVPVLALLAQSGGGYAVDVLEEPGKTRSVPVTLGAFASGNVEVTDGELTEGDNVVVGR